jgi:phosphohistidine phosphatase
MRLVLFRHGPAGSRDPRRWPDDGLRPLTAKGVERTRAAASGLRRVLGGDPVAILSSPLTRCVESAELVREAFSSVRPVTDPALAPGGSYRRILAMLAERKQGSTVILVGHEPDLGKLAGTLLFGAPCPLPMRKSGACVLDFPGEIKAGGAILQEFLPPRILRRLAGRKARA